MPLRMEFTRGTGVPQGKDVMSVCTSHTSQRRRQLQKSKYKYKYKYKCILSKLARGVLSVPCTDVPHRGRRLPVHIPDHTYVLEIPKSASFQIIVNTREVAGVSTQILQGRGT